MRKITVFLCCVVLTQVLAQNTDKNKFRQLYQEFATPNVYRTAGGAPGHQYYQQRVDYDMNIVLDDEKQTITGEETITYHNNSPDNLEYLWVQLDQNVRQKNSLTSQVETGKLEDKMTFDQLSRMHSEFDGGFKITSVTDGSGKSLPYTINYTMMRIDLAKPLAPKSTFTLKIKWWYNINDRMKIGGRAGYEYFEEDKNYLYTIAQFFPRMCVYNDVEGWQNKQFLGRGEFTLNFGNYKVNITVPEDHIVASTGVLQNESTVLTAKQKERLKQAKTADKPIFIVTPEEALKNESSRSKKTKTWVFKAENVRDFAFASSRKFIWDAQGVKLESTSPMAMSFYPKEGNPLWERYSTKVVAHTLKVYSKHTFDYPYPVAISVHSHQIGMEYPMICFNGGRPEKDGTYSERTKYGMLGVIIHEVGHNYFPMIVNSDERQWTWMDEGLNTFLQYLTEQEWERGYPSWRGPAHRIVDYMKGDKRYISPIMTNSESIWQFGNNAYGKPATALNILRETVMGRELFDYAFKMYANRWMFKHPTPEDFFRTMEDASGVDLDWFWHGWFYTTDHVDISLDKVKHFRLDTQNPEVEKAKLKDERLKEDKNISEIRNKTAIKQTENEKDPGLNDFYTTYDPLDVTDEDKKRHEKYMNSLTPEEKRLLENNYNYYELSFSNIGGLVMPIILEFTFEDETSEVRRIPAEIWRVNNYEVSKVFWFSKEVKSIRLDPFLETADVDMSNNMWPSQAVPSRFQLYKQNGTGEKNPMQKVGMGK
ncbi:MAG: M1 family metallopeptidase [Flavobacteriales bacterium]